MPLLFLLAGMASLFGLRRRSGRKYAGERVRRLLVPLVFGVVVLVPPQAYLGLLFHRGVAPDYTAFLGSYFADWSDLSGYFGTFTPGQLWFILFLLVISLGILPLMLRLGRRGYRARWLAHPALALTPALALAALSALPDLSGKNVFVYAGYFFAGFLLATDGGIVDALARRRWILLAAALLGMAAVLAEHATIGWQTGAAFALAHQLVTWVTLLAMLAFARQHLNRRSRVMTYLNAAAFPVFVLHQTFVVAAGYAVLQLPATAPLQYALIMALSAAASFGTYELARRVPVLRFLLGMKAPRTHEARTPAAAAA